MNKNLGEFWMHDRFLDWNVGMKNLEPNEIK